MLELLISLTGIIFGLILSFIAPEELSVGEKHFLWLKRVILLFIIVISGYYFFLRFSQRLYLVLPILLLVSFLLSFKWNSVYLEMVNYLLFVLIFLVLSTLLWSILVVAVQIAAVLIFLYGLPTGTLLAKKYLSKWLPKI